MLSKVYRDVRHSIVAFVHRFSTSGRDDFPEIVGTGFIVHEDGFIATNEHVIDGFKDAYRPPGHTGGTVDVLIFVLTNRGMVVLHVEVAQLIKFRDHQFGAGYIGPQIPDLAVVQVKARGLRPVKLRSADTPIEEGELIATAGFPLGSATLTVPGWLHQLSPTLQSGIVSAVHPFAGCQAHGFTINTIVNPGESGSPVFSQETGEVFGVVQGALTQGEADVPTGFGFAVPGFYLNHIVPKLAGFDRMRAVAQESPHIKEILQHRLAHAGEGLAPLKDAVFPW